MPVAAAIVMPTPRSVVQQRSLPAAHAATDAWLAPLPWLGALTPQTPVEIATAFMYLPPRDAWRLPHCDGGGLTLKTAAFTVRGEGTGLVRVVTVRLVRFRTRAHAVQLCVAVAVYAVSELVGLNDSRRRTVFAEVAEADCRTSRHAIMGQLAALAQKAMRRSGVVPPENDSELSDLLTASDELSPTRARFALPRSPYVLQGH